MSSFVANLLAGAKELLTPSPDYQAQERFTRIPIYFKNIPSGATYSSGDNNITASDDPFGRANGVLAHEATHFIYDKAKLKSIADKLLDSLPLDMKLQIRDSSTYSSMAKPYAGSPEQLTDEGLGYLVDDPSKEAQNYYNNVSSFIKDPKLRETLNRIRNNALKAKQ